ncbi:DUF29 domain-containing protein [Crocosphaera chwakensis]|uniref:DUF29 domain-containing protein n=1 Tax=Crocosphaera chwakensis CCY0110 TaxID=391612 RepID=A3IKN0_9CHRO|nr:DUF29 domain-containing protein [Crocosphaera chwakensis]EAZ92749.1 hypothetical protein CY0110_21672 [Crocosphaera chwakensis CCY0110]
MTSTSNKTLYNQDFALWIEETIKQLKSGNFSQVDLDNLIEEVESLGKSQRKAVRSYLIRLLEHLLKRRYVMMFDCYRGWEIEIRNFRQRLKLELEDSPSLKNYIKEILPKSYQIALENMIDSYPDTDFPVVYPFSDNIDELLNHKFWEH